MSKIECLRTRIRELPSAVLAFSGGVDSTFMAAVAAAELGDRLFAVTVKAATVPERAVREAIELASQLHVRHQVVAFEQLAVPGFRANPPERCYLCKRGILDILRRFADLHGIDAIMDGTNVDDLVDYRPGRRALSEYNVRSLLVECEFTKAEIRAESRLLHLPTADRPSDACLASRIPYGDEITSGKLHQVDDVEQFLQSRGIVHCRARHHGLLVRIEVDPTQIEELVAEPLRSELTAAARDAGFRWIAADLAGYRTGSLNPVPCADEAQTDSATCATTQG